MDRQLAMLTSHCQGARVWVPALFLIQLPASVRHGSQQVMAQGLGSLSHTRKIQFNFHASAFGLAPAQLLQAFVASSNSQLAHSLALSIYVSIYLLNKQGNTLFKIHLEEKNKFSNFFQAFHGDIMPKHLSSRKKIDARVSLQYKNWREVTFFLGYLQGQLLPLEWQLVVQMLPKLLLSYISKELDWQLAQVFI